MSKYLLALCLAGCATTGNHGAFDRCNTGRVIDACSPADYPPLTNMLPPWPFPRLAAEPPPPPQEGNTPGGRILKRLGK